MTETFPIVPAQLRAFWIMVPVLLLVIGAGIALGYSVSASRNARFEISPAGLRLRGDLYGRMIPAAQLRLENARAVDLRASHDLAPTIRTRGTALPGYKGGWFRLHNGERALAYVTDESRVAYVPTSAGYSVLLSVPDPSAFVASLRRAVAQHGINAPSR